METLKLNFEWFVHNDQIFGILKGEFLSFNEVPAEIKSQFVEEMCADHDFFSKYHEKLTTTEMLKCWIKLHYSKLDDVPDLVIDNGQLAHENDDVYKLLTPRETEVIKEVSIGRVDKQSCELLGIAIDTYHNHLKNIKIKLGLHSKVEITNYAFRHNLI